MRALTRVVSLGLLVSVALGLSARAGAQIPPDDPVQVKAVWKGKLKQTGDYKGIGGVPMELACEFTVTKRTGDKFEAELKETISDIEITYTVKGSIALVDPADKKKGYNVTWASDGSKGAINTQPITGIPYTAVLKDKKLVGAWAHPANKDGTTLAGSFDLDLQP